MNTKVLQLCDDRPVAIIGNRQSKLKSSVFPSIVKMIFKSTSACDLVAVSPKEFLILKIANLHLSFDC